MKKITLLLLLTANIIFAQNFTDHIIDNATNGVSTSFVVDVDTDGDLDLVSVSYVADELAWYENDGAQNFTKHSIDVAVNGAIYVNAGDGDGDGDTDILINTYDGNEVIIYFNDGSENFTKQIVDANLNGSNYNTVIDIDGDLDLDIFAVGFNDNSLVMYENDGAFNFTKTTIDAFLTGASSVVVEDIDGDTDFDLLVTSFGGYGTTVDGEVSWYENDGSQNFTKHSVDANLVSPATAYTVDFDADGDQDFILSDSEGNELSWYENDGTQNFTKHSVDTAINYPTYAHAVDFNNDGNLDIIASATNDNELVWYENDGTQNFTKHVISSTLGDSFGLFSADIDQDGDFDVAVASLGVDTLRWYENDFISPPANDDCVDAIVVDLTTIPYNNTQDATLATNPAPIDCNGNDMHDGVWYSFIGDGNSINIVVTPDNWDAEIGVYTGSCGAFVCEGRIDFNGTGGIETINVLTVNGTEYFINVGHWNGGGTSPEGIFTIDITQTPPTPSNNDCSAPGSFTVGAFGTCPANMVTTSTTTATDSNVVPSCDTFQPNMDLWYTFTVPADGDYFFNSITGSPGITVYTGSCGALVEVVCLNNTGGPIPSLVAGTTYLAQIWTDGVQGVVEFCIEGAANAPANNDIANAESLPIGNGVCENQIAGVNLSATDSGELPIPSCALYNGGDVWYTVVVPNTGGLNIETFLADTGVTIDTGIAVYSGTPGSLTEIDCNDDDPSLTDGLSLLNLTGLTPNETLYVRVWGYNNTEFGGFKICAWSPTVISVNDLTAYNFNYYPNPVTNTLTLTANNTINTITIYNMLGQEVKSLTTSLTEVEVDLTNLNTGTYFVKAQIEDRVGTFKIIKK